MRQLHHSGGGSMHAEVSTPLRLLQSPPRGWIIGKLQLHLRVRRFHPHPPATSSPRRPGACVTKLNPLSVDTCSFRRLHPRAAGQTIESPGYILMSPTCFAVPISFSGDKSVAGTCYVFFVLCDYVEKGLHFLLY